MFIAKQGEGTRVSRCLVLSLLFSFSLLSVVGKEMTKREGGTFVCCVLRNPADVNGLADLARHPLLIGSIIFKT